MEANYEVIKVEGSIGKTQTYEDYLERMKETLKVSEDDEI